MMTNARDIVDVFVGTPLGTSDHCFVSCVLRVEQSVQEENVRSTAFLKHHTNWDSVRSAAKSFIWSSILKSADPLEAFDQAIGEVIGWLFPTIVLRSRSGDKQWFDASCRRAYDANQTAYRAWCRARRANHWGRFVLARAEAQRVYCVERDSHNERTRNTLKHSTFSHKWLGTLKGSIFSVNIFLFLFSGGPEMVWWWLPLKRRDHSVWQKAVSWAVHHTFVKFTSVYVQFFGLPDSCPFTSASRSWYVFGCWSFGCVSSISTDGWQKRSQYTPKLSIIFLVLIRWGSFPECWWSANVNAISKAHALIGKTIVPYQ